MQARWINSRHYDLAFYLLPTLLIPLLVLAVEQMVTVDLTRGSLFFLANGGAHVAFGWTISHRNTNLVRYDRWRYLYSGLLLLGGAFLVAHWNPALVVNVYLYWGTFHFARQHWGFIALYRGKAREGKDWVYRLEWWALHAGMLLPVLWFAGRNQAVSFYGIRFWTFALPAPLLLLTRVIYLGLLLAYAVSVAWQWRQRGQINVNRVAMTLFALVNYYIAFTFIDNVLLQYLAANIPHSIQYLALVVQYQRGLHKEESGRFFQKVLLFTALYLMIIGSLTMLAAPQYGFTFLYGLYGLTIYHYAIDAWLWRPNHNPELKEALPL